MIMKSSNTMNETPHFFSLSIAGKTYMLGSASDDNRTKWMMFIKNITVSNSSSSSSSIVVILHVYMYVRIYLHLCISETDINYLLSFICRNQKSATSTRGFPVCYW